MNRIRTAPVFLNLLRIRFPVTAILSVLHRASGILLFVAIPVLAYMLDQSLADPDGYDRIVALTGGIGFRSLVLALGWAVFHHLLAGLRFLLIDMDIGVERNSARASAWGVNIGAGVLTVLLLAGLFA